MEIYFCGARGTGELEDGGAVALGARGYWFGRSYHRDSFCYIKLLLHFMSMNFTVSISVIPGLL